nr:hypothetical protein [Bradyrhizobium sp. CCBAU 53338]
MLSEDNGNGGSRAPGRPYLGGCRREDDIDLPVNELLCEIERLIDALGPLKVDCEIPALDISEVA